MTRKSGGRRWRGHWQGASAGLLGVALLCAVPLVSAEVTLSDAWVRALPPTQRVTAAYVTLHNTGPAAVTVVGGHSELTSKLEVHRSVEDAGYVRMERVPALAVAAGETVKLAPGGVHLMLLDLQKMPAEGEVVNFCLALADGSDQCTDANVQRGPTGDTDHSRHH